MTVITTRIIPFTLMIFLFIQFYRPHKNNHPFIPSSDFLILEKAPVHIAKTYKNSCYDCHSNQSNYSWFDNIAPISWYVDNNIRNGKKIMNLSEWNGIEAWQRRSFLSAISFDIETNKMPPKNYMNMHPNTNLSEEEKLKMINWIQTLDFLNHGD